ncbi:MAG: arsenate reductase ArsC [Candidatus Eisenbacteria bacterium]|nr:arsenate reductase ArsC [Candidatus Eisenbacteria bacterium]
MSKLRVLFICVGNAARSQMAESWLRLWADDRFEALSAGTHPTQLHPLTVKVMREVGADMSRAKTKSVREVSGPFDFVITTCAEAEADCPTIKGTRHTYHWNIPDPVGRASILPSQPEKLEVFRRARDLIGGRVDEFLTRVPDDDPSREREIL